MLENNDSNGIYDINGTNGNAAEALAPAPAPRKKRVSTKDLSERIAELEKKIEALTAAPSQPEVPSDLEAKMSALMDQVARLDERVARIAQSVAQSNLRPIS
jgi:hypothetical protein